MNLHPVILKQASRLCLLTGKAGCYLQMRNQQSQQRGKTAPTKGTEEIINEPPCGLSSVMHTIRSVEIKTDQGKKFTWEKQVNSI